MIAVKVSRVSKTYRIYSSPADRLKELGSFNRLRLHEEFWALRDVSFDVEAGESFGIIGQNGSGKSTLLQIIAGVLAPTSGAASVNGRLSAILELGAGFNPEFTGRNNVYLNASIFGLDRDQIDAKYDAIRAFADIGDFIDQPVKTYSTGMVMRLAFAVAIHVDPEILVVDEALAVGDIAFRHKCMQRVHELRSRGVTILFVSHESGDVKALCDRCVWLDGGRVRALGQADEVIAQYLAAMVQKDTAAQAAAARPVRRDPVCAPELITELGPTPHRYGDGRARVLGAALVDEAGDSLQELPGGARVVTRVSVAVEREIESPIVGFLVRDAKGVTLFSANTATENRPLERLIPGDQITVDFHWTAPQLAAGTYGISAAVSNGTLEQFQVCDYLEDVLTVRVPSTGAADRGYLRIPYRVTVVPEPTTPITDPPTTY
jgi:lipopolysaccharide transport system ATP-binding protein